MSQNPDLYLTRETKRWHSLLKKLREEKKIDEIFENMLSSLSLEEVIALKLELSLKTLRSPIYNLPIWHNLDKIVRDAVLKFAVSITNSPSEAARIIGIDIDTLKKELKHFRMYGFFTSYLLKKREKPL